MKNRLATVNLFFALCLLLVLAQNACAQTLAVSTWAGLSDSGSADGSGLAVRFLLPTGLAVDASGNVYVTDGGNDTIRKITPSGVVTTLAGSPQSPGAADGLGAQAGFSNPCAIAVDALGRLFVADTFNNTVRETSPGGVTATIAGAPGTAGFRNGPSGTNAASAGLFNNCYGITVDLNGNVYVADTLNNMIRKIANGYVSTLAGSTVSASQDGVGTNAGFSSPTGVATDAAGNVYVAEYGNDLIRRVSPLGVVTTLAGQAGVAGSANGVNTSASFFQPYGIAVDAATNIYVADTGNHLIRKITPDTTGANWTVTNLAGSAGQFGDADGLGANARFDFPRGVAVDSLGNVYVADSLDRLIRKITPGGLVTTLAGPAGSIGSADGATSSARFNGPYGVAADTASNLYVADTFNHTIREISAAGNVMTLAGSPGETGSSDGTNEQAEFNQPTGLAVDAGGNIYVADHENSTVRKITRGTGTNWVVSTLTGKAGVYGFSNGPVSTALFNLPYAMAVDAFTNLYVTDFSNQVVRLITPSGTVSTYAGTRGVAGYGNGTGASVLFDFPTQLAVDGSGNVYVADSGNGAVRKIALGGATSTITGTLKLFNNPLGLAVNAQGAIFVSDATSNIVREIATNGVISIVAGTTGFAGSADGLSVAAQFDHPGGLAVDPAGNLYLADIFNDSIRKMAVYSGQPLILAQPPNETVFAGAGVTLAPVTAGTAPVTYQWLFGGTNLPGATNSTLTLTNAQFENDGSYQVAATNSLGGALGAATMLTVADAPFITAHAGNQTIGEGSNLTLSVTVEGVSPLNYQWAFQGTNLNSATSSTLTINNATSASAGSYQVFVNNSSGSATSLVASVQLAVPPSILVAPSSQHNFPGGSTVFSISAGGAAPLFFQWTKNGTNLVDGGHVAGSSTPTLGLTPTASSDAGSYAVVVTNAYGSVTSAVAVLAVGLPGNAIGVSGFNRDVVVENTANNNDTPAYAQSFGIISPYPFAFYEAGLDGYSISTSGTSPLGLPQSGSFTSLIDGATVFQFAPYTAANVLYLTPSSPSGALTFSNAAAYDSLSVLAASSDGGGEGSLVLQFSDGSSSPALNFNANNWYDYAAGALTHFGLAYDEQFPSYIYTFDPSGGIPNLYQTTLDLDVLGLNTKSIVAVLFNMAEGPDATAGTSTGIFALSGTPAVPLQNAQAVSGAFNFAFPTVSGQSYTIQETSNLNGGTWQPYQQITGNGQTMPFSAPLTNAQQFFRLTQP